MAKRNVFLQVGNGADDQAVPGGSIDIQPFYAHADGSTWIFGSAKTYFITSPASSVSLTVGQYYWFYPRNPQGTAILAQIPVGAPDIYYKDLVPLDPATMTPALTPGSAYAALANLASLTPTDGQMVVYSSTLGVYTVANPVGAGRIAANVNVTGTPTTSTPMTAVTIPSTAISVTNSAGRPVVIRYGATFLQTALGRGSIYLVLEETTSGAVDKMLYIAPLPNTLDGAEYIMTMAGEFDIGVVTTTRTFEVRSFLYRASGSTATGNILNSANNPSWCRADAA